MTHRERILCAIRHQLPDRIPVDTLAIETTIEIGQLLGIPADEVIDTLGIDSRLVTAYDYLGELPEINGKKLSIWGAEDGDDYGTTHTYPLAMATSLTDIERYAWPDASKFDFASLANSLQNWTGEYALRGPYWVSAPLFSTTCNLLGMEEALVWMLAEPTLFQACIEQVFRFSYHYIEQFIATLGPKLDILVLADDFASQRGLLMEPNLWRKHLKPYYEQLFSLGKSNGLPIWFHSCGDITAVLPDLIDIGLDVWETVQLHSLPMTATELKRNFGQQITFFGGVNTQRLPFISPQDVARETINCIEALGAGGGYICGPDHHIKPDVPAQNTLALFQTAQNFAREGYTR